MFAENGTRYLSCQCSATELQQLDNIHPSQSSLMSYTGDSKCLSCTPCSHTVCDVKTWLRVDKKLLDLFYNLALMRAILYFGFVVVVFVLFFASLYFIFVYIHLPCVQIMPSPFSLPRFEFSRSQFLPTDDKRNLCVCVCVFTCRFETTTLI